jgi:hypothetical protein
MMGWRPKEKEVIAKWTLEASSNFEMSGVFHVADLHRGEPTFNCLVPA